MADTLANSKLKYETNRTKCHLIKDSVNNFENTFSNLSQMVFFLLWRLSIVSKSAANRMCLKCLVAYTMCLLNQPCTCISCSHLFTVMNIPIKIKTKWPRKDHNLKAHSVNLFSIASNSFTIYPVCCICTHEITHVV